MVIFFILVGVYIFRLEVLFSRDCVLCILDIDRNNLINRFFFVFYVWYGENFFKFFFLISLICVKSIRLGIIYDDIGY